MKMRIAVAPRAPNRGRSLERSCREIEVPLRAFTKFVVGFRARRRDLDRPEASASRGERKPFSPVIAALPNPNYKLAETKSHRGGIRLARAVRVWGSVAWSPLRCFAKVVGRVGPGSSGAWSVLIGRARRLALIVVGQLGVVGDLARVASASVRNSAAGVCDDGKR